MLSSQPSTIVGDQRARRVVEDRDRGHVLEEQPLGVGEDLRPLVEVAGLAARLISSSYSSFDQLGIVERHARLEQEQEVLRIVVVADPAGAHHVEVAVLAQVVEVARALHLVERRRDAEHLQLVGDRRHGVAVVLRGVVAQLDREAARLDARLLEQRDRRVLAVERVHVLVVELRRVLDVVVDARRHEGIGRQHRLLPDLLGDELAVEHHRDRLAHPRVLEHRLGRLDRQVVGAEVGRDAQLLAEVLAHVGHLLGGHVGADLHLARLEAPQAGRPVLERDVVDRVDRDVLRVVELGVLLHHDPVVRREALEHVGAVGDHGARPGELVAVLLHARLVQRQPGLMGEQRGSTASGSRARSPACARRPRGRRAPRRPSRRC
jgi:hypothetical protein